MGDPREWFPAQGIAVFPLRARSKEPACAWLTYTGPTPTGNYGVRLGVASDGLHLVVLDTDTPEAEAWCAAREERHFEPVGRTPFRVRTAKGWHRYYRAAERPPRFVYPLVDGDVLRVEVKSEGQYVVGPGSRHPNGSTYHAEGWSWRWDDMPILPDAWIVDERVSVPSDGDPYVFPARVTEPGRHDELFRLLRAHKARGDDRAATREVVSLANQNRCKPPIREDWTFEQWFERAWTLRDRPLIDIEGASRGIDTLIEDA